MTGPGARYARRRGGGGVGQVLVRRFGRRWLVAGGVYVMVVTGVVTGWELDPAQSGLVLAAIVVTLPFGVAGIVGVYLVYGLLQTLGRALGAHPTLANGANAPWFTVTDGILVVVLFGVAAAGNVLLAHDTILRRRARRQW